MTEHDPKRMDEGLIKWLRHTCGIELERRAIPNTLGSQMVAMSIRSSPDLAKAMNRTREVLKPASEAELRDALASLQSSTRRRRRAEDTAEQKLERFETKLRGFPRDIALHVLATWDDTHEEFPAAWSELRDECEKLFVFRRQILPALQAFDPNIKEVDKRSDEEIEADSQGVRAKYVETMKRLGAHPRRDMLPAGHVDEGAVEPPKQGPAKERTIGVRMMDERRAAERDGLERRLHPDFPIYADAVEREAREINPPGDELLGDESGPDYGP